MILFSACAGESGSPNGAASADVASTAAGEPAARQARFGELPDGRSVTVYTVTAGEIEMRVTDYGATITSLLVPDAHGERADIVLGFDRLEGYLSEAYRAGNPYFGAVIGRYGNRIGDARFELDGETVRVTANTPPHMLHGGTTGFDRVLWRADPFERADAAGVIFRRTSPAGEEGFPGTLDVEVTYTLRANGELAFDY